MDSYEVIASSIIVSVSLVVSAFIVIQNAGHKQQLGNIKNEVSAATQTSVNDCISNGVNSIDSNSVQNSRTIEGNTELEVVQEITDNESTNEINDDWLLLKQIMVKWISNHQEQSIDISLAFWLDPAGSLLRKYNDHKQLRMHESREVQAHFLLEAWKSNKASEANIRNLISILKEHNQTAEAVESIQKTFFWINDWSSIKGKRSSETKLLEIKELMEGKHALEDELNEERDKLKKANKEIMNLLIEKQRLETEKELNFQRHKERENEVLHLQNKIKEAEDCSKVNLERYEQNLLEATKNNYCSNNEQLLLQYGELSKIYISATKEFNETINNHRKMIDEINVEKTDLFLKLVDSDKEKLELERKIFEKQSKLEEIEASNNFAYRDEHAKKKIVNVIKSLKRGLSSSQMDHDYVFPSTDEMDQEVSLGKEKSEKVENTNTMDVEPDKISSVRKRTIDPRGRLISEPSNFTHVKHIGPMDGEKAFVKEFTGPCLAKQTSLDQTSSVSNSLKRTDKSRQSIKRAMSFINTKSFNKGK